MKKQVEELVGWIASEIEKHHIGCNFSRECDSKCGKCAAIDIVNGLSEKFDLALIDRKRKLPLDNLMVITDAGHKTNREMTANFLHDENIEPVIPLKEVLKESGK